MAKPGFEERFRECLGSEEFEEKIDNFLKRKALLVLQESELPESKDDDGFHGGEFSLKAHSLWKKYLEIIEEHMVEFQANEGLSERDFKDAVEDVGERHPFLVKLMIASWEFPQFIEMCREYVNDHEDELGEEKSEGKGNSKYDDEDDDGKDSK